MKELTCKICGGTTAIEKDGKLFCESCENEIQSDLSETDVILAEAFENLNNKNWKKATELCNEALKSDSDCTKAFLGKLLAEKECCSFDDLKKLRYTFEDSANYTAIIKSNDEELKMILKKVNDTISEINSSFGVSLTKVIKKSTKVFSIISGIVLIIYGLLNALNVYIFYPSDIKNVMSLVAQVTAIASFVLLGVFSFKKKQKGIKIMWVVAAMAYLIWFIFYQGYWNIICIAIYTLYAVINQFQEKIFDNKAFGWLVFILPIVQLCYCSLSFGFDIFTLSEILLVLGVIFHLLYLISANKKSKRI